VLMLFIGPVDEASGTVGALFIPFLVVFLCCSFVYIVRKKGE